MLRFARQNLLEFKGLMASSLLILLAGTALAASEPLVVRQVIDRGISSGKSSAVVGFSILYLGLEALRAAVEGFQGYLLRKLTHRSAGALRKAVFGHLQRLPLSWFDAHPPGVVVSRSTSDTMTLGETISTGMVGLFRDGVVLLGVAGLVVFLEPRFGLLTLLCSFLAGIPAFVIRRSALERAASAQAASTRMHSVLEENISGHSVIRLCGAESTRGELFGQANGEMLKTAVSTLRGRVLFDAGASIVSAASLTLVIGLAGSELSAGRLSFGLFIAFVQYGSMLLGAIRGISEKAIAVLSGAAAGERLLELLSAEPALTTAGTAGPEMSERGLSLTGVRFGYRAGEEVIKDVSAVLRPGERLALAGRTGAGKTTLARLLGRLYDPWDGVIRMDGRDLRAIPEEELRRRISFVTQQVILFRDTVLENVRIGTPGVGRTEVIDACREAGAHSFIEALPKGYDTRIGEGGFDLSVGERQLLSCARVFVRQPSLLILDEPTANVDPRTEALVLGGLHRAFEGRTSIIIAHRASTLAKTDRTWVMSAGRIVADEPTGDLLGRFIAGLPSRHDAASRNSRMLPQ